MKPCPFCGWPAKIRDMGSGCYHVQCTNCPARMGETWSSDESIEDLKRFWNERNIDVTVSGNWKPTAIIGKRDEFDK